MIFTISNLESNTDGGVVVAHWIINKTSGEHTATSYGSTSFTPDPSAEGYKTYDSLVEADVISWLEGTLDTAAFEEHLDNQLEELANPSINLGTPWE